MTSPAVWTAEEKAAVRSLKRLARRWPRSLTLFSAAGSLLVMRSADYSDALFIEDRIEAIDGIPNDGGDPDWTTS